MTLINTIRRVKLMSNNTIKIQQIKQGLLFNSRFLQKTIMYLCSTKAEISPHYIMSIQKFLFISVCEWMEQNYSKGGTWGVYLFEYILGIRVDDGKLRISSEKFFFSTILKKIAFASVRICMTIGQIMCGQVVRCA